MIHEYGAVRVRPAQTTDAVELAPRLREADLREIQAGSNRTPQAALESALSISTQAYAIECNGRVEALFGVADTNDPQLGAVWLLGSDNLKAFRYTFLRHSKTWLNKLFADYRLLGNWVDARNTVHIEWLKWLGFRGLQRAPIGRNGEVFVEFAKLPS